MFWVYGDNVVKRGFPMVGTIIIAINILIYLLMAGLWRQDMESMPSEIRYMMSHRAHSQAEYEEWRRQFRDWYRTTRYHQFIEKWGAKSSHLKQGHFMCLISSMFIHGGFSHILGNMLMLWALLGTLEVTLGQVRFFICYMLWGLAASCAHVFMNWGSDMPLVGASGAIAGMVGAYFVAFGALTKIRMVFFLVFKPFYFMIPTGVYVFLWILSQLAGMEAEEKYGDTGVAWYCHAGGFALGVMTMLVFRREVLSKLIRNKSGELQALDDEEREEYEKKQTEKAAREGLLPPEEEDIPVADVDEEEEEVAAGPRGIRPWHVILGIAGLMLLAAAYIATRKDDSEEVTTVISATDKDRNKEKKAAPADWKGKPLTAWVDALRDDNINMRRGTATELCSIDPERAAQLAPLLAPGLKDEDDDVRRLSAYVLSNIKLDPEQGEVVSSLDAALRDKNKSVRRYAATALGKIGISKPAKLAPIVQAALADTDPDVRRLGVYIHQNMDPDGTRTAPLNLRVDLLTARDGFTTKRVASSFKPTGAAVKPPAETFRAVRYPSPAGELVAYVTPDPGDGKKHPAVLWAHGGFSGIGSYLWLPRSRSNDQSARAFREAGFVLMCPSWRNEHDNPGKFELFYGEVNDLLAARDYLAELPYVDPERIYLAGHSTGGTLTLLAATATDKFRAAFAFGGAPDMHKLLLAGAYNNTPFDSKNAQEARLRSATLFTPAIRRPTFYFEGEDSTFNQDAGEMAERAKRAQAPFQAFMIKDGNHFDILDPITRLVARKILQDNGDECTITFSAEEVQKAFAKRKK
jgi:membrane associated rhomboid family serine protease/dienelactone hydrolase